MKNELIKFFLTSDNTLYRGNLADAIYNFSMIGSGALGELAEGYYANRFNSPKLAACAKGADLEDGTEVKAMRRSYYKAGGSGITVGSLKNKGNAKRIVLVWEDQSIGKIKELIVHPDELRNVDGTMPNKIKIWDGFLAKFGDRVKTLAEYDI